MPVKTRRWNDPPDPDDGFRLLICRYRPRGVSKQDETWDAWRPELGPSKALHAAVYTQSATPIPWQIYRRRYLDEQRKSPKAVAALQNLVQRVSAGETV